MQDVGAKLNDSVRNQVSRRSYDLYILYIFPTFLSRSAFLLNLLYFYFTVCFTFSSIQFDFSLGPLNLHFHFFVILEDDHL